MPDFRHGPAGKQTPGAKPILGKRSPAARQYWQSPRSWPASRKMQTWEAIMACNSAWIRPPRTLGVGQAALFWIRTQGQDRSTGAVARLFVAALSGTIFAK
ncbi:MAG: hypothetical protein CMN77_20185 [Spirochaetaceae bacterium]|nr:hypothetical protein [Spirochaetaceae bacterium]